MTRSTSCQETSVALLQSNPRAPIKRMKQMARDHQDVLQNIEFPLVNGRRDDPRVDDRDARAALLACLHGKEPDGPRVTALVEALEATRRLREDVPDVVWREGLL